MKAYLAAPIFTERDRNFNSYLEAEILKRCPDLDLYLAQNNASINDKTGCANSADIYVGDVTRLKESDMVITIMSGDMPPIGSSYEVAYFCALCEQDPRRRIIALYDDSREGQHTYSNAKKDAMVSGIAENQWPYINLLAIGYVKKWGNIYHTSQELIDAVEREYKIGFDKIVSGIYKITNLKNNLCYIGQSQDIYSRWQSHKNPSSIENYANQSPANPLYDDINFYGLNYFKFEILEKCAPEKLDEREKYWIEYYDSYNTGYNKSTGGSDDKQNSINSQCIPIYSYFLDGVFAEKFDSIAMAKRALNLRSGADISRAATANDSYHISANRMWRYYYKPNIEPYKKPLSSNAYSVYCYDPDTRKFITAYDSNIEASVTLTGKRNTHIADVLNGKRKTCMGFLWAEEYFDYLPDDYYLKRNKL